MTITNKQVKVITDVDFNNNKIKNAKIDATENEITNLDTLPSQTGKAGKYLKTNGTVASWETVEGGGGTSDHTQLTNRDVANQHPISAITNLQSSLDAKANSSDLATVATSGSYNDLENKPTIPSIQGLATEVYVHDTANAYIDAHNNSNVAHSSLLSAKQDVITSSNKLDYSLISNTPTIPTVNDGQITITQGGVTKGTFTTNQNSNTTIDLDAGGQSGLSEYNFTNNTGTSLNTGITLAQSIIVFKNGNKLYGNGNDYSYSGQIITFETALIATDIITVFNSISSIIERVTITKDTSSTTATPTLNTNTSYRYTSNMTSITVSFPTMTDDYESEIIFVSGTTATSFNYTDTIKWTGDNVSNNIFTPVASKTYDILFWYDSINLNAMVRGV